MSLIFRAMEQIAHLLKLAEEFCVSTNIAEATLSNRLFMDGKRLTAIRAGSDVGVRRIGRAIAWLSDNWPPDVDWPAEVPRPSLLPEAAE
jgi:hypothetical protein